MSFFRLGEAFNLEGKKSEFKPVLLSLKKMIHLLSHSAEGLDKYIKVTCILFYNPQFNYEKC